MNVNFELYRIFYVVATVGNITKASQQLLISQPAVTKQIKSLENQLGGELFIRTKRGVILTENGKEIYKFIKQGMHCFENAELQFSNLKQLQSGVVRIGVSTTLARIFLLEYLEKFHEDYPNVAVHIFTDPSSIMRKMLKEGKLDILIAKEKANENDEFEVNKLGELHHCFVAGEAFSELKGKIISLKKLNEFPILLPKTPSTTREMFDNFCKENNTEITSKLEIASSSLLEDFAKIGLGVGLVTKEYAQKEIDSGKLFEVITEQKLPSKFFSIITLKDSYHSFGTNKFIELLLKGIKK